MRTRMISSSSCLTRSGARGSFMQAASRDAMASRRSTSRNANRPPSDDMLAPSKRATIVLPWTGDRPGNMGIDSTLTGMLFRGPMGLASTPESYIESAVCTMSVSPHEFSGLAILASGLRLVSFAPGSRRHPYEFLKRAVECGLGFVADFSAGVREPEIDTGGISLQPFASESHISRAEMGARGIVASARRRTFRALQRGQRPGVG